MGIVEKAVELLKERTDDESAKAAFAARVQTEIIEPVCQKFDIAFIVHPRYDEATFVSKEVRPDDPGFEGIWYRPSWGGASGTMGNVKDRKMAEAVKACWDLIRTHRLVSSQGNRVQSFENGIDARLKERVLYRLGYLANCP